ncbi:MAG: DUF6268 family outer membrane beta-barrel protein [Thermonemataceae bacterium]
MKKLNLYHLLIWVVFSIATFQATAQVEEEEEEFEEFDPNEFADYGDVEETKRFCTQKVRNLTPTKLISIGYEVQLPFDITSAPDPDSEAAEASDITNGEGEVQLVHGMQLAANFPVISKSSIIVNLALNYNESLFIFNETNDYNLYNNFDRYGLRTAGFTATMFKPLNETNFIYAQGSANVNNNFTFAQDEFDLSNSLTYSGAVAFGWKKSDDFLWAVGAARTYRGGQLLYIPLLIFNRTFNDRWGTELALPALGHLRRNISPKSILRLGYEIVGNSYFIQNLPDASGGLQDFNELHLRRSEIKAQLIYERSLKDFIWISFQGGVRFNYRFNVSESLDTESGDFLITNEIGNPLYFGISLNLVSP